MYSILVTGSRDWSDEEAVHAVLDQEAALHDMDEIVVIHGGATGADTFAEHWASAHGVPVLRFLADWDQFGKSAGFVRNRRMIKLRPDMVLAFIKNDSRGATMTRDMAKARHLEVRTFAEWGAEK